MKKNYGYIADSRGDNTKSKKPAPKASIPSDSTPMMCENRQSESRVIKARTVVQATELNVSFRLTTNTFLL